MEIEKELQEEREEVNKRQEALKKKERPQWKIKIEKFIEHYAVVIFMSAITIYSLFFDDIRAAAFGKDADIAFYSISFVCMIMFLVEILLASISKVDYFLTFFFWLDVVSTISMIPDVGFIWEPIIGIDGSGGQAKDYTSVAKTSRAGRVTRVIRIIRLIRLIRIVKLYK